MQPVRIARRDCIGRRQSGAVLLLLLTVLVLAGTSMLLEKLNHRAAPTAHRQQRTAASLLEAKEALIGYALTYTENHPGQPQGYLPCPDVQGNGSADAFLCKNQGQSVIGLLPWRTLDLPPLRDGAGECLWYAVSGSYKNNPKQPLTSDTDGLFVVEDGTGNRMAGVSESNRAIAIVFSPGSIIGSQSRDFTPAKRTECGSEKASDGVRQVEHYLEALNGINNAQGTKMGATSAEPGAQALPTDRPSTFISAPETRDAASAVIFNDTMIVISPSDFRHVYARMDRWVAEKVTACLDCYAAINGGGKYPWAAMLDAGSHPDYADDEGQRFGRIPDAQLTRTKASDITMLDGWPLDPDAGICFDDWWWWAPWKEMVFFTVDKEYEPGANATNAPTVTLTTPMGSPPTPTAMAARTIVIVAGRKLGTQNRSTAADKGDIRNYLEASNATLGDESFISGEATSSFNDVARMNGLCP